MQFHHKFDEAELAKLPFHDVKNLVSRPYLFQKAIWEKQISHEIVSYQPLGTDTTHRLRRVAASLAGRWLFTLSIPSRQSPADSQVSKPLVELHAWDLQAHLLRPGELLSKARTQLPWGFANYPGVSFFEDEVSCDLHLVVHATEEASRSTFVVHRV